jgi:hypothetical protein
MLAKNPAVQDMLAVLGNDPWAVSIIAEHALRQRR